MRRHYATNTSFSVRCVAIIVGSPSHRGRRLVRSLKNTGIRPFRLQQNFTKNMLRIYYRFGEGRGRLFNIEVKRSSATLAEGQFILENRRNI